MLGASLLNDMERGTQELQRKNEDGKVAGSSREKIKDIRKVLPKLSCDFCGLGSCG